jgi:hypothetical protein
MTQWRKANCVTETLPLDVAENIDRIETLDPEKPLLDVQVNTESTKIISQEKVPLDIPENTDNTPEKLYPETPPPAAQANTEGTATGVANPGVRSKSKDLEKCLQSLA